MRQVFGIRIIKDGDWYVGSVPSLPGANTQGRTKAEVRRNLREAIGLVIAHRDARSTDELGHAKVSYERIAVHL